MKLKKHKVHFNFCYVFCFLIFNILFFVDVASAQAPKVKHVYKDKVNTFGSELETQTEPVTYSDYSPSGKLFTEKLYIQGQEGVVKQYYYNKKDSLIRETCKGFLVETDSTVYTYSSKYDTTTILDYYQGKVLHTSFTAYHKNGKKITELEFWAKDSSGHVALYDTTGKLMHIKNSNEGIKYDKFGNMIQWSKDGTTLYSKYSDDGKKFVEEELVSINVMESYKYTYSYTKDGYLLKTVLYTNGYMSKKSATSKMVYSDSTVTTYTYNSQNNKTSEYVYGKGDKITKETFYAYDKENRLIKETVCKTVGLCTEVITYSYDKYGNTLEEAHYKGMNGSILDWKYVYTYEFY